MSRYNNLPGVNIDVKDGQMMLTQDNTSNSVLIIGEVKAPSNIKVLDDAVLVQNEDVLFENFGRYFYQGVVNPIAAEWYVARNAGVQNIYLLGLNEATPKANFIKLQDLMENVVADYQFSHIIVSSMYADEDVEGLTAEDFGVQDIGEVGGLQGYFTSRATENAVALGLSGSKTATLTVSGASVDDIALTVKRQQNNPQALVDHLTEQYRLAASALGSEVDVVFTLDKGKAVVKSTDDVTLSGLEVLTALKLTERTSALEGIGNPAQLVGNFAEKQTVESEAAIVYIATRPPRNTSKSEIRKTVDRLVERRNEFSRHVQVIAGPQVAVTLPGSLRTQWLTGVTQYAVLVNSLAVQNAPTNQPVPGVSALRYDLSLRQLDDLTGNKYVTFRTKNNRIVVVDGVTTAPDLYVGQDVVKSDFTRLSTLRSINYMVKGIREVTDPFIGQPNEFPTYNSMNTAIKGLIKRAIELGVIQDAAYSIKLGDDLAMDKAIVDMTILPQFELRDVDVSIGLATPAGFESLE